MSGSKPGQSFEPFYPSAIKKACEVLSTRRTAKQVARLVAVWASRWTGNVGVWADGHHWSTSLWKWYLDEIWSWRGSEICNTCKNSLNHIVHIDWNWLEFPLGSIKYLSIYLVKICQRRQEFPWDYNNGVLIATGGIKIFLWINIKSLNTCLDVFPWVNMKNYMVSNLYESYS